MAGQRLAVMGRPALGLVFALLTLTPRAADPRVRPADDDVLRRLAEQFMEEGRGLSRQDFLSRCGLDAASDGAASAWLRGFILTLRASGDEEAVVRLEVSMAPEGLSTQAAPEVPSELHLNLRFVREGENWRPDRCRPAEADLADALLETASLEGRQALLQAETGPVRKKVAGTLHDQGDAFFGTGEYDHARLRYERALEVAEGLEDQRGITDARLGLGSVALYQGEYALALAHYRAGLRTAEESGNPEAASTALTNLGWVQLLIGNLTEALASQERSLAFEEKAGHEAHMISPLGALGSVYTELGDYTKALAAHDRARRLAEKEGDPKRLPIVINNLAMLYDKQGDTVLALRHYREALQLSERNGNKALICVGLLNVGIALVSAGAEEEAVGYLERGIALAEETENKARGAEALWAAGWAHQKGRRYARAKDAYERSLALMQEMGRRAEARLDSEAFEASLYSAHPELRARRGEIQVLGPEALEGLVPGPETALVEYVVAEEGTQVFVLSRPRVGAPLDVEAFQIPVSSRELASRVGRFRTLLAERSPAFAGPARELHDLLLRPVEARLGGRTTLGIVPDGPLWDLPFQALKAGSGRYVLEGCAVFYAPSLSVLALMTRRAEHAVRGTRGALLALGNPDLGRGASAGLRAVPGDGGLRPLPEAEKEVRALRDLYGPASRVYTGAAATEARVKAEAGHYRVLHLATHGTLDDASPLFSHLVLSPERGATGEDGVLEAREILDLDLGADLTVLSACQTGRGRVQPGEGVIGMSWALLVAGCPSAVVSQWKVDSASTTRLMVAFHRNLAPPPRGAGLTMARALRRAALTLLRDDRSRHPFYWAGFVLVGRDATLDPSPSPSPPPPSPPEPGSVTVKARTVSLYVGRP